MHPMKTFLLILEAVTMVAYDHANNTTVDYGFDKLMLHVGSVQHSS